MKKVLWIEDNTGIELPHLITPVLFSGEYDLTIAHNASEAVQLLQHNPSNFDIIIFDLDLMPGNNPSLRKFYGESAGTEISTKNLGGELLRLWLGKKTNFDQKTESELKLATKLNPNHIGILSVLANEFRESDFYSELNLNPDFVVQKDADMPREVLLKLISTIDKRSNK